MASIDSIRMPDAPQSRESREHVRLGRIRTGVSLGERIARTIVGWLLQPPRRRSPRGAIGPRPVACRTLKSPAAGIAGGDDGESLALQIWRRPDERNHACR